jgi:outer membrane immunogenic protein
VPASNPRGWFGGGQIGYNLQGLIHPNLVLGIEADFQGASLSDSNTGPAGFGNARLSSFGTVRGRAGYAFDRLLPYFTGGFAWGHLHEEICCLLRTFDGNVRGYALGGGVEYKFMPAWSVKFEYQYLNFGHNDATLTGVSVCTLGTVICRQDAFHTIRIGLNYHFLNFLR